MTEFQIILAAVTLFFIYKIYDYIQNTDHEAKRESGDRPAVSRGPSAEELVEKADIAYEDGDTQKAQSLLEAADAIRPDDPEITGKLAFMRAENGHADQAIKSYLHAITLDRDNDLFHAALASLYRKKGMVKEAKNHYEKALAIDPEYEITYYNYGNLLQDAGETETAKKMYEKAVELNADFAEAKEELDKLS